MIVPIQPVKKRLLSKYNGTKKPEPSNPVTLRFLQFSQLRLSQTSMSLIFT